jgi:hypothetical protein
MKKKPGRFTPRKAAFIRNAFHKDCTCQSGHCLYHNYPAKSVR